MKKAVCVILAALMCTSLIGCKTEEEKSKKKATNKAEEAADDEDSDEDSDDDKDDDEDRDDSDDGKKNDDKDDDEDDDNDPVVDVKDGEVAIDKNHFPDDAFREYIASDFDEDGNGVLSEEEIENAYEIRIYDSNYTEEKIYPESLDGIEYLTELTDLYLYNCKVTSFDFSKMPKLEKLYLDFLSLGTLDVSACQTLKVLHCDGCELTELIMDNPNLEKLSCRKNDMEVLDLSGCPNIVDLNCDQTPISELDLSDVPNLESLHCFYCPIESLDLSYVPHLQQLCLNENPIESIDLSVCPELDYIACSSTGISELDVSQNTKVTAIHIDSTAITSLDVSSCPELSTLYCEHRGTAYLLDPENEDDMRLLRDLERKARKAHGF